MNYSIADVHDEIYEGRASSFEQFTLKKLLTDARAEDARHHRRPHAGGTTVVGNLTP